MRNAITVDLEDWPQSVLDPSLPITERVVRNTERVLRFLDRHGVRATFFALGKVCERFPHLLPMIDSAGHEVASHGYGHELVYNLTPEQFEADIRRSIAIIEAQIGRRPLGYRAPAFSITRQSLWAGPILARNGFQYSSSIFPIHKQRYGIADAPRTPFKWSSCHLVEFPMTTLTLWGKRIPVCGGGYTRLLPSWVHTTAIRRMNAAGFPAVVYMHPYELAAAEVTEFVRSGLNISRWKTFTQSLWRTKVVNRLDNILDRFEFAPARTVLDPFRRAEPKPLLSSVSVTGNAADGGYSLAIS